MRSASPGAAELSLETGKVCLVSVAWALPGSRRLSGQGRAWFGGARARTDTGTFDLRLRTFHGARCAATTVRTEKQKP